MTVRARLEEKIVGGEEALATARQMFQVFTSNKNVHCFPDDLSTSLLLSVSVLCLPSNFSHLPNNLDCAAAKRGR